MTRQTIAITGATSGFGLELARMFAARGSALVLIGRRQDRLDALVAEFGAQNAHALCCDVRDASGYAAALGDLPSAFHDVDVLINNAGIGLGRDRAQEAALGDWLAMLETNVTGLIAGTQALLPGMVRRNRGHIVNIGSIAAQFPTPRNAIYAGTKAFARQFALCLRADLFGTMVRVTTVEPGQGGDTEFTLVRERGDEVRANSMYGPSRLLTPRDVAETVLWVVDRPAHVNVNLIQFMSVDQSFGPLVFTGK
ncbi:MAG: SDR family NAD(P)-dependent oxidoreductase [Paracoccaceae bacterium]|nr:MAG: SDR family NAD(P)-dependent oxidoreductase [Paracoccaceae bacterium]